MKDAVEEWSVFVTFLHAGEFGNLETFRDLAIAATCATMRMRTRTIRASIYELRRTDEGSNRGRWSKGVLGVDFSC